MLFVASSLLLGARWGAPTGVAVLIVAGVLAATGITAVTATFARTAEQIGSFQAIVAVVLGMLGGTFFPASQASGIITKLTWITPHAWLMRGFTDLAAGDGLGDVLYPVGAVLLFGTITGGIGLLMSRRLVSAS